MGASPGSSFGEGIRCGEEPTHGPPTTDSTISAYGPSRLAFPIRDDSMDRGSTSVWMSCADAYGNLCRRVRKMILRPGISGTCISRNHVLQLLGVIYVRGAGGETRRSFLGELIGYARVSTRQQSIDRLN